MNYLLSLKIYWLNIRFFLSGQTKKADYNFLAICFMWSHLGLNQGPPDYESAALTNCAIGPARIFP